MLSCIRLRPMIQLVSPRSGTENAWGASWLQNKKNPDSQSSRSVINTTERLFREVLKNSTRTCINMRGKTLENARQFHLLLQQTERPSPATTPCRSTQYS